MRTTFRIPGDRLDSGDFGSGISLLGASTDACKGLGLSDIKISLVGQSRVRHALLK
jgi:hypothetical protein